MAASPSERSPAEPGSQPPSWWRAVAVLDRMERLAGLGALILIVSTPLSWYRAPIGGLVKTGWGNFGWAEAALLLTAGAALGLLAQVGRGRRPPMPLHEGTLLAAAGVWSALIVVYLMFDRPQFELAGFNQDYSLAWGIFVALGGAVVLIVAGLRIRRLELKRGAKL